MPSQEEFLEKIRKYHNENALAVSVREGMEKQVRTKACMSLIASLGAIQTGTWSQQEVKSWTTRESGGTSGKACQATPGQKQVRGGQSTPL